MNFELAYEFEPGVFVGTVLVRHDDRVHWIVSPDEPGDWQLYHDGFVDMTEVDGQPEVDRFSRTAAGLVNPLPCWTRQHVEAFVRRKLDW